MAQEKPNRLVEWVLLLREQGPALRRRLGLWLEAVREEPLLIWATPVVRYAAYGLGAVIALAATLKITGMITPPPPPGASAPAATADFHVVCSDPVCAHHFVIHRQFGFGKFPVRCLKCKRQTGAQARLCNSSTCRGRWVAPATGGVPAAGGTPAEGATSAVRSTSAVRGTLEEDDRATVCPNCGGRME